MDSSFLTGIHVGLGLVSCFSFIKLTCQFGVPNHPARFISYLVALSVASYFSVLALTDLNFVSPWEWMKWKALPQMVISFCLLFQIFLLNSRFTLFQHKIFSRFPLILALISFALFPSLADYFVVGSVLLGGLFLIISVKKARYEKRLYFKMLFFFLIQLGLNGLNFYHAYFAGQLLMFATLFYLFLFEQSSCLKAMMESSMRPRGDLK